MTTSDATMNRILIINCKVTAMRRNKRGLTVSLGTSEVVAVWLNCPKNTNPAHWRMRNVPIPVPAKRNRNRPISKSISSHRAKSGLTWTMKIKATNKDASTEQPSSTDICSINCFLVAPLTVRKRHSRTRCRKRSI